MGDNEFKILADKIANGTASQQETLAFITELNSTVVGMREDLAEIKKSTTNN